MTLSIRPLLSALGRSPAGAILVTLQIAITLAVLVNAAWIVRQHIAQIELPTGFDTQDTFAFQIASLSEQFNVAQAESEDLAYLRALPDVVAATITSGIPLTGQGSSFTRFWRQPGQRGGSVLSAILSDDDQSLLTTLAVSLRAGREFTATEILPLPAGRESRRPSEIIITQALAQALFPAGNALGNSVYDDGNTPLTVIGITSDFMGAVDDSGLRYQTTLLPTTPGKHGYYSILVRTRPGSRDAVLNAARQHIGASRRDGVISATMTLVKARQGLQTDDRNMAIFLTGVTALMLAVCCLGVFGLTTFNVGSRTRQIGTRRAVGARRRDIVAHFMMENAIILTLGALLGSVLALAVGYWLTLHYSLPRLDLGYLLAGVVVLWLIGLLAAWQPARRAASVAPSVATRTV